MWPLHKSDGTIRYCYKCIEKNVCVFNAIDFEIQIPVVGSHYSGNFKYNNKPRLFFWDK